MVAKRNELSDGQWDKIASPLPGKAGDPGRTGADNRIFINGCLWVLRSGAHWCDPAHRCSGDVCLLLDPLEIVLARVADPLEFGLHLPAAFGDEAGGGAFLAYLSESP